MRPQPSEVLARTIGVKLGSDIKTTAPTRDLLQETLIEAHRNGLIYIAWFEYGFMAAHKDTMNHLRRQKPEWLSRDINGSEVAPNGFVWLNPLHPEARKLLLDFTTLHHVEIEVVTGPLGGHPDPQRIDVIGTFLETLNGMAASM